MGIVRRTFYRRVWPLLSFFIIAMSIYHLHTLIFRRNASKALSFTSILQTPFPSLASKLKPVPIRNEKRKLINWKKVIHSSKPTPDTKLSQNDVCDTYVVLALKKRHRFFMQNTSDERPHFTFLLRPWKSEATIRKTIACNEKIDAPWSMVFVVKSAIKNSDRRNAIRNTWGGVKLYRDVMFEIVFILGNSSDAQAMAKIETENQKYGDILQYNKKDTAEFVPEKVLAGMQWTSDLPSDWLYSSIDDDVSVHYDRVYKYLDHLIKNTFWNEKPKFNQLPIVCGYSYQDQDEPARNASSKWFMPEKIYPIKVWPIYCRGGMYTTSSDMVKKLYAVSRRTPRLYLDDVWVTGFMRLKVKDTDENIVAAPGSKSNDLDLINNVVSSDALVQHFWGNIEGKTVNVVEKHKSVWKNSTDNFYEEIKCFTGRKLSDN